MKTCLIYYASRINEENLCLLISSYVLLNDLFVLCAYPTDIREQIQNENMLMVNSSAKIILKKNKSQIRYKIFP